MDRHIPIVENENANIEHNATISNNTLATEFYETEAGFIEVHSVGVKLAFICVACMSIISSVSAITFMHRSKKIPYAAKFLSTGLLTFDVLFIVTSTIRKFVTSTYMNVTIQTMVTLLLNLAVLTVVLMAIERYVLILYPMVYVSKVTKRTIRISVTSVWVIDSSICLFFRYGACYYKFRTEYVFTTPAYCNKMVSLFYGILLIVELVIACVCYWKIFRVIQSKVTGGRSMSVADTVKMIRTYRSTSIVFVYIVVITSTVVAYLVMVILIQVGLLRLTKLRYSMEFVSFCNCILDPFLYVLWFKECRLELLKVIAVVCRGYRQRVEDMRINVYNIVITDCKLKTKTNREP